jgi:hypothetical protein
VNEFVQKKKTKKSDNRNIRFFLIETPHYRLGGQDGNLLPSAVHPD